MKRPLSPHLQVYRLPLSAVMSISHRITGIGMVLSLFFLFWFVFSINTGKTEQALLFFFNHWFGKMSLILISFSCSYHFFNGIRHVIWDMGYALTLNAVTKTGYGVLLFTLLSTLYFSWNILS